MVQYTRLLTIVIYNVHTWLHVVEDSTWVVIVIIVNILHALHFIDFLNEANLFDIFQFMFNTFFIYNLYLTHVHFKPIWLNRQWNWVQWVVHYSIHGSFLNIALWLHLHLFYSIFTGCMGNGYCALHCTPDPVGARGHPTRCWGRYQVLRHSSLGQALWRRGE